MLTLWILIVHWDSGSLYTISVVLSPDKYLKIFCILLSLKFALHLMFIAVHTALFSHSSITAHLLTLLVC